MLQYKIRECHRWVRLRAVHCVTSKENEKHNGDVFDKRRTTRKKKLRRRRREVHSCIVPVACVVRVCTKYGKRRWIHQIKWKRWERLALVLVCIVYIYICEWVNIFHIYTISYTPTISTRATTTTAKKQLNHTLTQRHKTNEESDINTQSQACSNARTNACTHSVPQIAIKINRWHHRSSQTNCNLKQIEE